MNTKELAWAAGLFEGEGSIFERKSERGNVGASVTVVMTDEDSVRRFHTAVGVGKVYGPYPGRGNCKQTWRWSAHTFQDVQYVVCLLWYGLGERRRATAALVLLAARASGTGVWTFPSSLRGGKHSEDCNHCAAVRKALRGKKHPEDCNHCVRSSLRGRKHPEDCNHCVAVRKVNRAATR